VSTSWRAGSGPSRRWWPIQHLWNTQRATRVNFLHSWYKAPTMGTDVVPGMSPHWQWTVVCMSREVYPSMEAEWLGITHNSLSAVDGPDTMLIHVKGIRCGQAGTVLARKTCPWGLHRTDGPVVISQSFEEFWCLYLYSMPLRWRQNWPRNSTAYHTRRCNIPENTRINRRGNLKSTQSSVSQERGWSDGG
jgi:hypothetical protein